MDNTQVSDTQTDSTDIIRELMLDGNAVGGMFHDLFGVEMTATPTECANCGNEAQMGELLAFTQSPGAVLRCPACENVVLRIVETREAMYLDARGALYIRLEKRT
jgi:Zn finger protein HypA/HybF involved in hydrogenase expression